MTNRINHTKKKKKREKRIGNVISAESLNKGQDSMLHDTVVKHMINKSFESLTFKLTYTHEKRCSKIFLK